MATKPLSDFLPEVLPHVKECPDLVAENAVRNAAIDLCELGRIWRYDLDPISIAPSIYEYDLNYPANTYPVDLLRVVYDGAPLDPKTREDLDRELPGWSKLSGDPVGYFLSVDKRKIRIVRTPVKSVPNGIEAEAALKPSRAASVLEEFIYENYLELIALGARWKLYAMADMPWMSATKAEDCMKKFHEGCGAAAVDSARSHSRAPLRVTPVYSLR